MVHGCFNCVINKGNGGPEATGINSLNCHMMSFHEVLLFGPEWNYPFILLLTGLAHHFENGWLDGSVWTSFGNVFYEQIVVFYLMLAADFVLNLKKKYNSGLCVWLRQPRMCIFTVIWCDHALEELLSENSKNTNFKGW